MTYEATRTTSALQGKRCVTAFFESRTDAEEAVARLQREGIPRDNIRMIVGSPGSSSAAAAPQEKGFWEELKDMFMPDEDRHTYAEGLRRGGFLVSVYASDTQYERAIDILDDEGTIDLDQRAGEWRSQGWTGVSAGSTSSGVSRGSTSAARAGSGKAEEVIPIAQEELRVGKRDVSHGRVRVRSYVEETPVTEQVRLREEHVNVQRRPADRAVSSSDRLFQDRTVEVEQRAEQAVVAKNTRVVEEVVINKDARERTETVSDTVRKTKVDVEDERGSRIPESGTPRSAQRS
jgi:uncharacterized protein (TIGR02271 family)